MLRRESPMRGSSSDDAGQQTGAGAGSDEKSNPFMFRLDLLQKRPGPLRQPPIAVVIAETLEAATEGAALLSPRYQTEPARVGLDAAESFVPPSVGSESDNGTSGRCRGRSHCRFQANQGDLRDRAPVSQCDGAACDRGRMGRRHASRSIRRAKVLSWRRGASQDCSGYRQQDPHPQSVPRRRLRLQGPYLRTAGSRDHGGPHGGQAGQAGAQPGADVRSGGTPGADAADLAAGGRQ